METVCTYYSICAAFFVQIKCYFVKFSDVQKVITNENISGKEEKINMHKLWFLKLFSNTCTCIFKWCVYQIYWHERGAQESYPFKYICIVQLLVSHLYIRLKLKINTIIFYYKSFRWPNTVNISILYLTQLNNDRNFSQCS
jgi:hypothetical protein